MTSATSYQTEITAELATQIITLAMEINIVAAGTMPESDADKISEAKKIVELAHQQMVIVEQIGEHNVVPKQLEIMKAIVALTPQISIDEALEKFEQDVAAPPADPAPVSPPPPAPEAAPASPPPPPAPPAAAPALPTGEPVNGEVWVDAEGSSWQITNYAGGPQLEARSVDTGETTVLPTGFLQRRAPDTQPPSPSPPPSPAPASTQPPSPSPTPPPAAPTPPVTPPGVPSGAVSPEPPSAPASPSPSSSEQPSGETVASDLPFPPSVGLVPGELRTCLGDSKVYKLESEHDGNLIVVDGAGMQAMIAREQWIGWPYTDVPAPSVAVEPPAPPEPAPVEQVQAPQQTATVIVDDDEGDEDYAKALESATASYMPQAMPVPMDLEQAPTAFPADLTEISDIEARRLHSQFNALAARARYLHGLEAAKARACERVYEAHVKDPMRESRAELGKDAALAEVRQRAEEHPSVEPWLRRRDLHRERADAYKTFLSIYTEHVTVLSRDWTMRASELEGS